MLKEKEKLRVEKRRRKLNKFIRKKISLNGFQFDLRLVFEYKCGHRKLTNLLRVLLAMLSIV